MWNSEGGRPFPWRAGYGPGWVCCTLNSALVCSDEKRDGYGSRQDSVRGPKCQRENTMAHLQCNNSHSNSSCPGRRTVALGAWRDRWCMWNTPRETPAPWRYSRFHHQPRCPHSEHSDLKEDEWHKHVATISTRLWLLNSRVCFRHRFSYYTKIVFWRRMVHVIHQLLGEPIQLLLRPCWCCPLLKESKYVIHIFKWKRSLKMYFFNYMVQVQPTFESDDLIHNSGSCWKVCVLVRLLLIFSLV